jgi:hypothetical protein
VGGAAIAVIGLVALVYSVIEAPEHGWLATRTVVGLALAAVLLVGFVVWELHQAHPLLDPRVFRKRPLAAGSMSISIQFFAFYGYTFIILQYLQLVRGDTPLLASVQVLPLAATMMPASRLSPWLTARFGARSVCATGLLAVAGALLVLSGLVLLGAGMGCAMTPATSAITEGLPAAQQGVGSALNDLSREVGGAIGIAVIGSILTATYSSHVNLAGLSGRVAGEVKASYAAASHLSAPIAERAHSAFVTGMHVALLSAAGAALFAAVGGVLLLARQDSSPARRAWAAASRAALRS